jgi:hypothetical protein
MLRTTRRAPSTIGPGVGTAVASAATTISGLRTGRRACAALIVVVAAAMSAGPAVAGVNTALNATNDRPLHVISESAVYCTMTGMVDFTLRFDHRPNVRSVDEYRRRQDSFQYYIVGDNTQPYPQNYDAIIRGDELMLSGSKGLLPIRQIGPAESDPASGGWGPIRAIVPVRLRGSVLTFSAPLSALSDHTTDGRFTYELQTVNFGATVDFITNESAVGRC